MEKKVLKLENYINKPKIDWVKMKIEAFRRLDENNRIRDAEETLREVYPRIGDHIYKTVEKLITLFRKKFERGETDGFKLRFTYSYFKQHADSRYCLRTFMNHFRKLTEAYQSIFRTKGRTTLQLPGRDVNCVVIEFSAGVVQFTDVRFNSLPTLAMESVPVSSAPLRLSDPPPQRMLFEEPQHPRERGSTQSVGDLLGSLFSRR